MKEILFWKWIDLLAQVATVIFALFAYFSFTGTDDLYIVCYVLVGGSQAASCLINKIALNTKYKIRDRRWYENTLLIVGLGCVPGCGDIRILFFMLIGLLYVSPVFALWYWAITAREVVSVTKKFKEVYNSNQSCTK